MESETEADVDFVLPIFLLKVISKNSVVWRFSLYFENGFTFKLCYLIQNFTHLKNICE